MAKVIPAWQEVAREAIIVMGGALVAAFIVGQVPQLRDWMKNQWAGPSRKVTNRRGDSSVCVNTAPAVKYGTDHRR